MYCCVAAAAGVRKVHFSDDTPRVHHYRPEGKGDLSDEDSCDSLEEEMPPHAASDLVEDFTTENSDLQPPKNGSMWGWLNKKHVPPKGTYIRCTYICILHIIMYYVYICIAIM